MASLWEVSKEEYCKKYGYTRHERADRMLTKGGHFKKQNRRILVKSQTRKTVWYKMMLGKSCNCQDFANGNYCKHLILLDKMRASNLL
jgi:hypothetical protein